MNIVLEESEPGCLEEKDTKEYIHTIADVLYRSVLDIANNDSLQTENLLCRSAFTFAHYFYDSDQKTGIGYKCCSFDDYTSLYNCDMSLSDGWQITWIGPLIVLGFICIKILIGLLKKVRRKYDELSHGSVVFEEILHVIKDEVLSVMEDGHDMVNFVNEPNDLLSFHEKVNLFDALMIDKRKQKVLRHCVRVAFYVVVFCLYYVYFGICIYYYRQMDEIKMLNSRQAYVNVFGHLGWLFIGSQNVLSRYAVFETIVTFLYPIIVIVLYVMLKYDTIVKEKLVVDLTKSKSASKGAKKETGNMDLIQIKERSTFERFVHSFCGRISMFILFIVAALYGIAILSV